MVPCAPAPGVPPHRRRDAQAVSAAPAALRRGDRPRVAAYADRADRGTLACDAPKGAPFGESPDCNDDDDEIYPGNPDVCDGLDNDCSGTVDDGPGMEAVPSVHPTMQAAVNATSLSEVVCLAAGTYNGQLSVASGKRVRIVAAEGPRSVVFDLGANGVWPRITVEGSNSELTFEDVQITGTAVRLVNGTAGRWLHVNDGGTVILERPVIEDLSFEIQEGNTVTGGVIFVEDNSEVVIRDGVIDGFEVQFIAQATSTVSAWLEGGLVHADELGVQIEGLTVDGLVVASDDDLDRCDLNGALVSGEGLFSNDTVSVSDVTVSGPRIDLSCDRTYAYGALFHIDNSGDVTVDGLTLEDADVDMDGDTLAQCYGLLDVDNVDSFTFTDLEFVDNDILCTGGTPTSKAASSGPTAGGTSSSSSPTATPSQPPPSRAAASLACRAASSISGCAARPDCWTFAPTPSRATSSSAASSTPGASTTSPRSTTRSSPGTPSATRTPRSSRAA